MEALIEAMSEWGTPTNIISILIGIFAIMQIIGEIVEWCGKVVPEYMKIRKYFNRKQKEKQKTIETLKQVEILLKDVNKHYNADNIRIRDTWMASVNTDMEWMHEQAKIYDSSIQKIVEALDANTKMTEDMFVENSRDRIIDFAEKVIHPDYIVSHEQFNRIFRVHDDYEKWLKEHNRTNGEVDINYQIIQEAYAYRVKNHCFAEDLKGYAKKTATTNN